MRAKLSNRRQSETRKIVFTHISSGKEQSILITVGFDQDGVPKEVFCADFKAGSDLHAIVMDACILVSRVLQYGDSAAELAEAMCKGPSLIGVILSEVAMCRGSVIRRRPEGDGVEPFGKGPSPLDCPQAAEMV